MKHTYFSQSNYIHYRVRKKQQILFPAYNLKELGIFHANISLHSEVSCDIEIVVEKSEENQESN